MKHKSVLVSHVSEGSLRVPRLLTKAKFNFYENKYSSVAPFLGQMKGCRVQFP